MQSRKMSEMSKFPKIFKIEKNRTFQKKAHQDKNVKNSKTYTNYAKLGKIRQNWAILAKIMQNYAQVVNCNQYYPKLCKIRQ